MQKGSEEAKRNEGDESAGWKADGGVMNGMKNVYGIGMLCALSDHRCLVAIRWERLCKLSAGSWRHIRRWSCSG